MKRILSKQSMNYRACWHTEISTSFKTKWESLTHRKVIFLTFENMAAFLKYQKIMLLSTPA